MATTTTATTTKLRIWKPKARMIIQTALTEVLKTAHEKTFPAYSPDDMKLAQEIMKKLEHCSIQKKIDELLEIVNLEMNGQEITYVGLTSAAIAFVNNNLVTKERIVIGDMDGEPMYGHKYQLKAFRCGGDGGDDLIATERLQKVMTIDTGDFLVFTYLEINGFTKAGEEFTKLCYHWASAPHLDGGLNYNATLGLYLDQD